MKMNNLLPEVKIYRLKNNVYYIIKEHKNKLIIKGNYEDYLNISFYIEKISNEEYDYKNLLQLYIIQNMINNKIKELNEYRRYLSYPFLTWEFLGRHNNIVIKTCSYKMLCYL